VAACRGDALLELAHLVREVRLVADGGGHASQQGGDLGARLGEPEDVVDEQQDVLALDVAEVLRHGQGGQGDAQASPGRLVHLAEHERGLVEDAGLLHLHDEVVALTGALADAREDGDAAVFLRDALDHLLDEDGLADPGAAEQADLASEHVGGEQVDDLDARLEHLGLRLELVERRGLAVDGPALGDLEHLALLEIQALADDVEDVALGHVAHGDRDRTARVHHPRPADQAVGRLQRDGPHEVVAEVLGDLERHLRGGLLPTHGREAQGRRERVVHLRDAVWRELDVDDRPDHPRHPADVLARLRAGCFGVNSSHCSSFS